MTTIVSPDTLANGDGSENFENTEYYQAVLAASDEIRTTLFFQDIVPDWKVLADHDITPEMEKEWQYLKRTDPDFSPYVFAQNHNMHKALRLEHAAQPDETAEQHLSNMWNYLMHDMSVPTATRLALKEKHVVPGDRFEEGYYWDSYFAMLGMATEGRWDEIRGMVNNFAGMLEEHGMIPNGNRTYYLNRSQPPYFAKMVELLAQHDGEETYIKYLPALEAEHAFWMDGINDIKPGEVHRRLVCLPDGSLIARNFRDGEGPRPEMLPQDIATAMMARMVTGRSLEETYLEIGSICESGQDMTGRFMENGKDLHAANATSVSPVELNCLLFKLEQTIAHGNRLSGNRARAMRFDEMAGARQRTINKYFWNDKDGFYHDYNFVQQARTRVSSLSGTAPLYVGIAPDDRAQRVLATVKNKFLDSMGGAANTLLNESEHQWDGKRYWSFTNEMAIVAARRYKQEQLARWIGAGFLRIVRQGFTESRQFVEKYCQPDHNGSVVACAGEYTDTPTGFAPTNGLVQAIIKGPYTPELQSWARGGI